MENNLWGNLNELIANVRVPEDILEEQIEYLEKNFGGLVGGKVLRISIGKEWRDFYDELDIKSDFSFSFRIFSDYVDKYEYEICKLTYGIKMYPLAISFGTGIAEEMEKVFELEDHDTVVVVDEEMLVGVLQKILSSKEVHQVLRGLLLIAKKEKMTQECPF